MKYNMCKIFFHIVNTSYYITHTIATDQHSKDINTNNLENIKITLKITEVNDQNVFFLYN